MSKPCHSGSDDESTRVDQGLLALISEVFGRRSLQTLSFAVPHVQALYRCPGPQKQAKTWREGACVQMLTELRSITGMVE